MQTVGQLIDNLFETRRKPDGKQYTHIEVAIEMGGAIDPSYLSKLRNDKIPNPGRDTLLALCRVFRVQPSYFFPELDPVALEVPSRDTAREQLRVALRSAGLDPNVQAKIEELVRALQKEEKGASAE